MLGLVLAPSLLAYRTVKFTQLIPGPAENENTISFDFHIPEKSDIPKENKNTEEYFKTHQQVYSIYKRDIPVLFALALITNIANCSCGN